MATARRLAQIAVLASVPLTLTGCAVNVIPTQEEQAKAKWADVQNDYQRRADLIPNLVTTVQAYATHEKTVFDDVTKARAQTLQAQTLPEKAIADGVMQSALTGLLGVAEAYPDLKAVESFKALQDELVDTEDKIAAARRYYNTVVRRYNTATQTLPSNVVAGIGGFKTREYYRLEDDGQRSPVAVSLGA